MLAFTDADALRAWRPEGSACHALRGPVPFALALDSEVDAIWLNPAGPVAGKITHLEIEMLAQGAGEVSIAIQSMVEDLALQPGAKTFISAPAVLPSEALVDYVRRSLRPHPEVSEAYIFQTVVGDGPPHLTIGVRFGGTVPRERIEEIARGTVHGIHAVVPDEFINLILLDQDDLLQGVRKKVGPIFRR